MVEGRNRYGQLLEGGGEVAGVGCGAVSANGHEQRVEFSLIPDGVDVEFELDGINLGALLVGSEDAGARAGNGDGGGEAGVVGMEDIKAARSLGGVGAGRDPFDAGDAFIALRPHPAQLGSEAEGEFGGMKAVELEKDNGAGAGRSVCRREHDLADGKGDVGVGDDGAVGPDFDLCGLLVDVDGHGVVLNLGLDGEVAEDLCGQDPGLECAVLLAEENAALAGYGEGLEGFGVGLDDGARGVEGDGEQGIENRRGGLGQDRGSYRKQQCEAEQAAHHVGPCAVKANSLRHGARAQQGVF